VLYCYAGGQGVGYFDKDPLVNNGNAALRKNEGVEVSEDNVSVLDTACSGTLMHIAQTSQGLHTVALVHECLHYAYSAVQSYCCFVYALWS
jgi:hypothetical protein